MRSIYARLFLVLLTTSSQNSYAKLEAHEWGTFTSLVGSNGKTQNGMYHEDEPLPSFVHEFGELRAELPPPDRPCRSKMCFAPEILKTNIITQKMETPVIYFYSDREQTVDVNVRFPEGVVTETYPGPVSTFPTKENITKIANGNTTFSVKVLAAKQAQIPYVDPLNIYGHARNVNSNIVTSGAETEKFIFYRGIGRFQPTLNISSQYGALKLAVPFSGPIYERPQALFLVHVDDSGHGQMFKVPLYNVSTSVSRQTIADLKNHESPSQAIASGEQARGMLVDALVKSGLFKDEAFAMVNTWENGYLKVPGLRLLYVLSNTEVERTLPLKMTPVPEKLVRSFVGRIEVLLDTDEQAILAKVKEPAFQIESLGRFAEPILRRISEVHLQSANPNSEVTAKITSLIEKASVTNTGTTALH